MSINRILSKLERLECSVVGITQLGVPTTIPYSYTNTHEYDIKREREGERGEGRERGRERGRKGGKEKGIHKEKGREREREDFRKRKSHSLPRWFVV